jgi:hypothetical protein
VVAGVPLVPFVMIWSKNPMRCFERWLDQKYLVPQGFNPGVGESLQQNIVEKRYFLYVKVAGFEDVNCGTCQIA